MPHSLLFFKNLTQRASHSFRFSSSSSEPSMPIIGLFIFASIPVFAAIGIFIDIAVTNHKNSVKQKNELDKKTHDFNMAHQKSMDEFKAQKEAFSAMLKELRTTEKAKMISGEEHPPGTINQSAPRIR